MPGTLDTALDERDRLARNYNRAKRAEREKLFADPVHGDKLRRFCATLGNFKITDADNMLSYIEREAKKWLATAPADIRYAALEAIDERCVAIRVKAGLPPLDDPLPGEEPNVFFEAKGVLGL